VSKMAIFDDVYHPAGRLVPIFASGENLNENALTLGLAKVAAAKGETVLVLDCQDGALMDAAGIVYHKTLDDVIYNGADISDVKYITSNEHFTAAAAGTSGLEVILGSMAALSLSYDWVFVGTPSGCTPAHVRLAAAADVSVLAYDTEADKFMRAYWMMEAVRSRAPKFDPLFVSAGDKTEADDTALMLSETIKEFLGAPPPYAGHIDDTGINERLLLQMHEATDHSAVA